MVTKEMIRPQPLQTWEERGGQGEEGKGQVEEGGEPRGQADHIT